ncbi:ATP-binding protein [Desulfomarina profundi]|uniref:ATP-binding protein n=1 Tax=Desulfomarina profundi TaxID=2772557 RepID=UPI001E51823E|nr:hypothetical protein [Desulfomarina profundi]
MKTLKKVGYYGLADWDFLYDQKQKRFILIDINCRIGMTNQICSDAGVDLIWAAYNSLVHKQVPEGTFSETQKDNLHYINFEWDIGSFYRKKKEGTISDTEWLRSLMRARSYAFFSLQDPLPFLLTTLKIMKIITRKLFIPLH